MSAHPKQHSRWRSLSPQRLVLATAVVAISVTLAACSSSATGTNSTPVGSASGSSSTGALAAFEKKVNDLIAQRSAPQSVTPPATGPTAAKGKKVYVIACLQALEGCQRESVTAIDAGKALGWSMKLIDTQSAPDKMLSAVQTAINDKVDGIIVNAIDMATLAAPLKQAKAAGIKVVCFACVNSDNLADQVIPSSQSFYDDGYAIAAQMYKDTNGHPRILVVSNKEVGVIANRQKGTEAFVADCVAAGGDCKIVDTQYFLFSELSTRLPGLVTGELRQFPDTNCVWMAFDSTVSFIKQGVIASGVSQDKVKLYGFDGNIPNIHDIRTGGWETATMAGPFEWVGWAQIDALNRLFQGQAPVDNIVVSKLITKANLPPTDTYAGDLDFKPGYLKVWGVQQ